MAENWLERTALLVGNDKLEKIAGKHVLVVGLGGVGAYAAEMICRAGVGKLTLVDGDNINLSNLNRQLPALHSTIGKSKALVLKERLLDINPNLEVTIVEEFVHDDKMDKLLNQPFDYVVDAIDTLSPKVFLIYHSIQNKLKVVSSMGAGGKMDPSLVQLTDLKKSYNCKLARIIRKRLRKLGISGGFPVVFSPEEVDADAIEETEGEQNKKSNEGTISYMPAVFGIFCASKVIRDLLDD